jgi:hypothetical protein
MCPKKQTPAQAAHYWDAAPDAAGFAGTADYGTDQPRASLSFSADLDLNALRNSYSRMYLRARLD